MADLDLSFPRYVAARKGAASARAREGAHYAYAADLRIRSALDKVRPVSLSVEADEDYGDINLEALLRLKVVTASGGVAEESDLAPANVITVLGSEIADHGWRSSHN